MKLFITVFFVIALTFSASSESLEDLNDQKIEELFHRELEAILNEGPTNRLFNSLTHAEGNSRNL